jgi:cyclophilin family peptidyl-prolyl cis-trans isomerase
MVATDTVKCHTTAGDLTIEVFPGWSPIGAKRFLDLINDQFFTDIALYRSVENFLTQFGISDQQSKKHWHGKQLPDDPNLHIPITRGYMSFAGGGANTRSTQVFISYADLSGFLGKEPWETPFARVVGQESDDTLTKLYKGYGDIPPFGPGPNQGRLFNEGNQYIRNDFPLVSFIKECHVVTDTIDLKAADFKRELTEAPNLLRDNNNDNKAEGSADNGGKATAVSSEPPLNIKVQLEKTPRPVFSVGVLILAFFILVGLGAAVVLRPRRLKDQ